jgi:hypothetical protein
MMPDLPDAAAGTPADAPAGADTVNELTALRARVAALEAENADLAERSAGDRDGNDGAADRSAADAPPAGAPVARRRQRWRAPLSAICIVLAAILVPVSIVAAWTRAELVDQESFVQTLGPLAADPHVQGVVIDQSMAAIDGAINIEGLTNSAFDGIAELGLPPRAAAAIDLLRAPAASGVRGLIEDGVTEVVESDAFVAVWERALRASHSALLATVSGKTDGIVVVSPTGEVGVALGPIVSEIRERLMAQGVGLAAVIPTVHHTIVIAQSDALVTVNVAYAAAAALGWWLPLLTLALFGLGIALARRRSTALIGSGIGIALGGAVLLLAFSIAGSVLGLSAGELGVPAAALTAIFAQVTAAMHATATIVALLGVLLAVFAWLAGPSSTARRIQAVLGSLNAGARGALASHGLDTGAAGAWLWRQRVLVRVVIATLAALWLLSLRPLSAGDIALVLLIGLAVWWLAELAQRRPDEHPSDAAPHADAPASVEPETTVATTAAKG